MSAIRVYERSVYEPLSLGVQPMGKPVESGRTGNTKKTGYQKGPLYRKSPLSRKRKRVAAFRPQRTGTAANPDIKNKMETSPSTYTPLKVLPLPAASLIFFILFAFGFFDQVILNSGKVSFEVNPVETGSSVEPSIGINRASFDFPSFDSADKSSSELVFTRHRVLRGETLSRISYKYGLTPSTLISVNLLKTPGDVKKGITLIIPYIDGIRVTPRSGESPADLAARFGTRVEHVQLIPGSRDYFISGETSNGNNTMAGFSGNVFLYPVTGRILTAFGESVDTLTGIGYQSEGLDLYAAEGTPVKVSKDGKVILTGNHSSYGLYVIVSHSGGWKSFYGHLSRIDVAPGDVLESGTVLGLAGRSGTARSPRLYFALIHDGESVDPLDYLY